MLRNTNVENQYINLIINDQLKQQIDKGQYTFSRTNGYKRFTYLPQYIVDCIAQFKSSS